MKKLIGVTGKARSGKDTIANYLISEFGYVRYSFAGPLKEACSTMFGLPLSDFYNEDKKEVVNEFWGFSPRQMAQLLGTEGGRNVFGEDLWIKRAQMFINSNPDLPVVIPDVRFENEAKFIRDNDGLLIHVRRPGVEPVSSHSSEAGVDFYGLKDVFILNDGTQAQLYDNLRDKILL